MLQLLLTLKPPLYHLATAKSCILTQSSPVKFYIVKSKVSWKVNIFCQCAFLAICKYKECTFLPFLLLLYPLAVGNQLHIAVFWQNIVQKYIWRGPNLELKSYLLVQFGTKAPPGSNFFYKICETLILKSALVTFIITISCLIFRISAGDHGPFFDQPFTIKILYLMSKW